MARINFGWQPGTTLTYRRWSESGIEITAGKTSMPEVDDGWFSAIVVSLTRGDVSTIYEGAEVVGFGMHDPAGLPRHVNP